MKHLDNDFDLIKLRVEKAKVTLKGIKLLIESNYISFAMNRIYYSGFYIVSALVLLDGKSFSKHHQLIGYFNKEYLKSNIVDRKLGSILNETFERRNLIDYDDYFSITKSEVKKYYSDMKKFVKVIELLIKQRIQSK
jgi:hypothetical protein